MASPNDARKPHFLSSPGEVTAAPASFQPLGNMLGGKVGGHVPRAGGSPGMPLDAARGERVSAPAPAPVPAPPPAPAPVAPPPPDFPAIARAVEALKMQGERLAAEARSDALEIGFQVARRILEMEIRESPEPLFSLIRTAIRKIGAARAVKVHLNPDDLLRVDAAGGTGQLTNFSVVTVELVPDKKLGHGDCIVEAEQGVVDGRLETRLDELKRSLAAGLDEAEEAA